MHLIIVYLVVSRDLLLQSSLRSAVAAALITSSLFGKQELTIISNDFVVIDTKIRLLRVVHHLGQMNYKISWRHAILLKTQQLCLSRMRLS